MRIPGGVTFVAIMFVIFGLLALLWGVVLIGLGSVSWLAGLIPITGSIHEWGASALLSGLGDIASGVLRIIAGVGLLTGQFWGWVLAVIMSILWILEPLVAILHGNLLSFFGLIIPVAILVYLISPGVRDFFRRPAY